MNIFFSGIGGVGIGPLAEIACDAGYSVQGSDLQESSLTDALQRRSVPISFTQNGEFLRACHEAEPIDWFVHTSALPANHPELQTARELGIRCGKRDELLAHILAEKKLKLIAVAGTHGKTTTTGMLVWAFQELDIPVSYSVGTTLSFGPSGQFMPESEYFVYECDEFDRNFLHFLPHVALITSLDYDHPDTYPTQESYNDAFSQFLKQSDHSIVWKNDYDKITADPVKSWVLGSNETLPFALPGEHNRRNATLAVKTLEYLNATANDAAIEVLNSFPGTNRRFEKLAENLYSDYGHHPVEIAATLQLARELSDKVVLIYQPHQNVRQHQIKDDYRDCFALAETVYWLPTYLSREDPALEILSQHDLMANIQHEHLIAADTNEELIHVVQEARAAGKLVLVMGAGSIDSWIREYATN